MDGEVKESFTSSDVIGGAVLNGGMVSHTSSGVAPAAIVWAQSFKATSSYECTGLSILCGYGYNNPAYDHGDLQISLHTDAGGSGPGYALKEALVPNADIPRTNGWANAAFETIQTISENTVYHVVAKYPNWAKMYAGSKSAIWYGRDGLTYSGTNYDNYPGGKVWRTPVTNDTPIPAGLEFTTSYPLVDLYFKVWGGIIQIPGEPDPDPAPDPDPEIPTPSTWPATRPAGYNPDLSWQPGTWVWGPDYVATGGGRWHQQLVCTGNGKVYYEELT